MPATVTVRRAAVRTLAVVLDGLERRQFFNATPHVLAVGPLRQNWENTGLITSDGIWDNVPSIEGFTGDSFVVGTNTDPQTLLGPDTPGVKQIDANSTSNPSTYAPSGNVELSLNPVIGNSGANTVAFQGSSSNIRAPYLKFYLDATDMKDIVVRYDLIDIDGGSNTNPNQQKVALHYRIGTTGNFTNVALAYVPQASDPGGTGVGKTTPINVTLPAAVDGETHVEIRVITADIQGSDQLIAVENINISATPIDNAPGEFSFEQTAYTVSEGVGSATFTVRRLNGTGGVASVAYATSDGSAVTPGDYTDRAGVLTFGDGVDTRSFTVPIVNDTLVEASESFNLTLSNPTGGATLGTPSAATVTITDNEVVGEIAFSPASYTRSESAGTATLTVTRTAGSTGAASVNWTTVNDTATAPSDFVAANGTLTFEEGETTKTIVITLVDDLVEETTEQFKVSLSTPVNATLGSAYDATVTITNEDFAGTLGFGAGNYTVNESAGTVTLTVNRVNGSSGAASVNWTTVDGTATSPTNYTAASGTLNFANGETSKTITIDLVDNAIQESDKQFTVTLSGVTGASLGTAAATVTITNDDVTGQFALDPATYSVLENAGTVTLTVTRTLGSSGPASVAWSTVAGTATASGDFISASGVLNFANGETSKTIVITLTDDATPETEESFTVVLSNPTNGATLGTSTATVFIADDDSVVPSGLLLNEIDLNPPGSDLPYQFVELRGTPGAVLHGIYLLELEGDLVQNPGTINSIISLEGATIGSNGLLLIRSSAGFTAESPATGVFDTPLFDVGGIDFEAGSASFVLVFDFETFSLAVDQDLDPSNSGELSLPGSMSVLDAVGALDGTTNDRAYGAVVGPASTNPFVSDAPDAFARFTGDSRPSTSAAWFWGNLVGAGGDSKTYTTNTAQRSANFPDGGILTPGGVMASAVSVVSGALDYAGSSQSFVVTFSQDVGASLAASDFELVNLTAGSAPVTLTLLSVSGNGTIAHLGFSGTGGLAPGILADGDYQLRVKAGEVGNGAGSLPSDALFTFFFKNADLNHDRSVGFDDLLLLAQNYGTQSGATFATGDVNYDGRVDFDDLLALAQRYGQTLLTATPTRSAARKRSTFGDLAIA